MSPSTDRPQKPRPSPRRDLTRQQRRDRTARALATAAASQSSRRRRELLDYVVRLNMEVARSVASRYFRRGIEEDDLVQVAYTALTRATRDFDPSRLHDFLSYAVPTIRGELKRHFRDHGWTVRPPRLIQETQARITAAEGELVQLLGSSPRPPEIADHLGIEVADVVDAMSADGCFAPASLDRPVAGLDGGGLTTLGDLIGEEDRSQVRCGGPGRPGPGGTPAEEEGPPDPLPALLRGPQPARDRRGHRRHPDAGLPAADPDHARPAHRADSARRAVGAEIGADGIVARVLAFTSTPGTDPEAVGAGVVHGYPVIGRTALRQRQIVSPCP